MNRCPDRGASVEGIRDRYGRMLACVERCGWVQATDESFDEQDDRDITARKGAKP